MKPGDVVVGAAPQAVLGEVAAVRIADIDRAFRAKAAKKCQHGVSHRLFVADVARQEDVRFGRRAAEEVATAKCNVNSVQFGIERDGGFTIGVDIVRHYGRGACAGRGNTDEA